MTVLVDTLSLLTGAAGWHYAFYSRAAQKLEGVEGKPANARRVVFRRINGVMMMFLGALFFVGAQERVLLNAPLLAGVWLGVLVLLLVIVVLAMVDLRLTVKLRRDRRREGH